MYIESFDNFQSNLQETNIDESLQSVLKSIAIHGTKAVVAYLTENPELISKVFNELGSTKDGNVNKELDRLRN